MLSTHRCGRRTRRQACLNLETLDDRLVLSASAGAAAAEAVGARVALLQHRQEVRVARHEARHLRHHARHLRHHARHRAVHPTPMPGPPTYPGYTGGSTGGTPYYPSSGSSAGSSTGSSGGSTYPYMMSIAAPASSATVGPAAVRSTGMSARSISTVPADPSLTTSMGTSSTSSGSGSSSSTGSGSATTATGTLPDNVAAALQAVYQEYQSKYDGGDSDDFTLPSDSTLQISGGSVGVNLKMGSTGNFNTFLSQLQADGLQVSGSSASYGLVSGMLPISELPAVAQVAASVTPMTKPVLS